ncbi:hypothetical protein CU098_009027 [Rhizopus stolonifer]|uniref:Uncharacterized protein n=1 Tax=Rhizopus stolonifer TaxID=4846 RepID=A0A367KH91_RHIST|nr:hypothetical protein CU098_009027 [Rhizopus stolonifer]
MTKSKQATFYQRIISASHFMTRKSEPQTFETVHCDDDQVTLCEKPKVVYEYDVDQRTETIPKQTRNTAVLIVLSPNALTAGTIARQRRKSQKSMCNAS